MSDLKPCPFCGGEKIQFKVTGHFQPWTGRGIEMWYHCACYDCGCELDNGDCRDMRKAADEWNERDCQ